MDTNKEKKENIPWIESSRVAASGWIDSMVTHIARLATECLEMRGAYEDDDEMVASSANPSEHVR